MVRIIPRKMKPFGIRFFFFLSLIGVLWLFSTQNVNCNCGRRSENEFKKEQSMIDHRNHSCKLPNGDMHVCWIGRDMLLKDGKFYETLHRKANLDNTIILASVDSGFVDMAINFHESSFKRFNISNFLYICSDSRAVEMLAAKGIDCFLYPQNTENGKASEYGHKDFFIKQRVKRKMVAAALILGFTIVLSDIDMVFLKDPTPRFKINADVSFMMSPGGGSVCAGLYIANPTPASIKLHLEVLKILMTSVGPEQKAINTVLYKMTHGRETLKHEGLPVREFANGKQFFEYTKRNFRSDKPCLNGQCGVFVVHNNWILTKAAKIYRFKENGMWSVDTNGYYSNPYRQYLQFSNPLNFGNETIERDKSALKTALTIAKLLKRTLILPKFHCCPKGKCILGCSFIEHFHVQTFDKYFEGQYREHVFLEHPLVPDSIKQSVSTEIYVTNSETSNKIKTSKNAITFIATNYNKGEVSATDIIKWFGRGKFSTVSVLGFHSLYVNVSYEDKAWQDILSKAIIRTPYFQNL